MASIPSSFFRIQRIGEVCVLRLTSADSTNRLTSACVLELTNALSELRSNPRPLIVAGNPRFFSVGADLNEIAALSGPAAMRFSAMGQALTNAVASFPVQTIAVVEGHCMGGGLDLVLACTRRIASHHAVFGHRGAALGLMTGWGGTQRLSRLIGKGRALELFVAAEKVNAARALAIGLVDEVADDPLAAAFRLISG